MAALADMFLVTDCIAHLVVKVACHCVGHSRDVLVMVAFNCLQIISQDISKLQSKQTDMLAKIEQYKRKHLELSHKVLQVSDHVTSMSQFCHCVSCLSCCANPASNQSPVKL